MAPRDGICGGGWWVLGFREAVGEEAMERRRRFLRTTTNTGQAECAIDPLGHGNDSKTQKKRSFVQEAAGKRSAANRKPASRSVVRRMGAVQICPSPVRIRKTVLLTVACGGRSRHKAGEVAKANSFNTAVAALSPRCNNNRNGKARQKQRVDEKCKPTNLTS